MIRASTAFIFALLLLITAGPVAGEEMIKEGSGEGRNVYTGILYCQRSLDLLLNSVNSRIS